MFASIDKISLKCISIYIADVKSKQHFQDKNLLAGLRLSYFNIHYKRDIF